MLFTVVCHSKGMKMSKIPSTLNDGVRVRRDLFSTSVGTYKRKKKRKINKKPLHHGVFSEWPWKHVVECGGKTLPCESALALKRWEAQSSSLNPQKQTKPIYSFISNRFVFFFFFHKTCPAAPLRLVENRPDRPRKSRKASSVVAFHVVEACGGLY